MANKVLWFLKKNAKKWINTKKRRWLELEPRLHSARTDSELTRLSWNLGDSNSTQQGLSPSLLGLVDSDSAEFLNHMQETKHKWKIKRKHMHISKIIPETIERLKVPLQCWKPHFCSPVIYWLTKVVKNKLVQRISH